MSTYQLKENTLTASHVNPARESLSDEERKAGKTPTHAHDEKGNLLYKVGYMEDVTLRNGDVRMQEHFVKVPKGEWFGKVHFGTRIRFANLTLTTGSLSDGGFYESLKADDVVIVDPSADSETDEYILPTKE